MRESCSLLRLLLPVLPRPPPAPLLESEGGALLGRPATPGRSSLLPAPTAQPRSRGSRGSDQTPSGSRAPGPGPRPSNFVLRERPVPLGSGPALAWEATGSRAPGTWRLGSPDRAPGQSALALSALPAAAAGSVRCAVRESRNQSCMLEGRSWSRHHAHAPCLLFKLSENGCHAPP